MNNIRTKYALDKIEGRLRIKGKGLGLKLCIKEDISGNRGYYFIKSPYNSTQKGGGDAERTLTSDEALKYIEDREYQKQVENYVKEMHTIFGVSEEVLYQQYLDEKELELNFEVIKRKLWKKYTKKIMMLI